MFYGALFTWTLLGLLVGRGFSRLWKAGLIGVAIMVTVDYFSTSYNLYVYPGAIVYLSNLPLFLIIIIYGGAILYLNWLPARWGRRLLYTVYFAVIVLALEAVMHSYGMVVYPRWQLWYSYFLDVGGLLLLAFLSDFVLLPNKRGKKLFAEN